ncbi:hypothetical protein OG204_05185 [Streptomyces sp. NBC_01387]|uniref:hypothetical protein n=1 Tax=unclassified Streptomyces TaxID=2593676 RepID=UPI002023C176|nr:MULTISPECIES: hypothetical protein [unclassified Streptomyces]MCX4552323.1 hypothetical protein [Streptomyces sp. NBC_01500]WSC23687.1 hypothetical protein OIE60_30670 [Streptomyces sp. NBC_01766]WSV57557.1 hypothetical protein OG282_29865 [Streptomyces sp. NBC_01014]
MTDDRPVALDEYPVHQVPLSMKHVATGDRNAYDRCIFHVFDHHGTALLIVGLGVYPNTGVIDAYATLRSGDRLLAVRASDALTDDRTNLAVGPLRITVDTPLRRLSLHCDADPADPDSLSFDIEWTADFPAVWEPHHVQRRGERLMLEGRRFVQAGSCTGTVRAGGTEIRLAAGEWTGTRDRSWGVRPIPGEEGGRAAAEQRPEGFHWIWAPVRFEDRFMMVIAQEDADGYRTLSEALLVRNGRRDVQLGWPQADIGYRPGTRHPERAVIHLTGPGREPLELGVEILCSSPLALGAGYPPATDWQHGTWQGRGWTDRRAYDLSDPSAHPAAAFGVTDHAARFTLDGQVGHGIFEHGSFGRHDPSGFTGYESVAP